MPFQFHPHPVLPGVVVVEPRVFADGRGWFKETFKASDFAPHGIPAHFAQDNHSRSIGPNVVRGMHYQLPPMDQGKLIRCGRGALWNVIVDLRKGSPAYGRHAAFDLTEENHRMLWVPPGFANGFCTRGEVNEVIYKATNEYSPPHDRQVRWNDPALAIPWPVADPVLSDKDAKAPLLRDAENPFVWEG